jgi:uncharacterized protein with GYD domain
LSVPTRESSNRLPEECGRREFDFGLPLAKADKMQKAELWAKKRLAVPHYISLIKWTDQGIRNIKDSPKRAQAARKQAEAMGGKLQLWYTQGKYDIVSLSEFPDDAAAQKFLYWLGSAGNVRTMTLRAWPEEEAATVISQLP